MNTNTNITSLVPDDADVEMRVFNTSEDDCISFLVHAEEGPVFDPEAGEDVFLNCGLCADISEDDIELSIVLLSVQTRSFLKLSGIDDESVDDETEIPVYDALSEMMPYMCNKEAFTRFFPDLCELSSFAVVQLETFFTEEHPEYLDLFYKSLDKYNKDGEGVDLSLLMGDISNMLGEDDGMLNLMPLISNIDVQHDEDADSWTLTIQDGPYYDEDDDQYILFVETLEYSTSHPDCYLFTKNIITADNEETFYDDSPEIDGEWTQIDDETELDEKYFSEFEHLEALLFYELFDTVDDKDALIKLAEELEKEDRIVRVDDEDNLATE